MLKYLNMTPAAAKLTRRTFLTASSLGTAGFLVGCGQRSEAPVGSADVAAAPVAPAVQTDLNAFVRVGSDNKVTVIVKHLDKGQGVSTGLPTIVAEELDADWAQMAFEFAPADVTRYANSLFGIQGTGGSTAIANSFTQLRQAGAAARAMLVAAAAEQWQVPADEIAVAGGIVSHGENSASFGELAAAAGQQQPPATPTLKSPDAFTLIGSELPRMDSPAKTTGAATFTIDVQRPGMKMALVAHPPRFGSVVKSVDSTVASAMPGVADVFQIPTGVAVVADSFWQAKKARDALVVEWDDSAAEVRGSDEIMADYKVLAENEGALARNDGDVAAAFANASQIVEHRFEHPFLAHATMEPMDCVVEMGEGRCDIWTGSQIQTLDQQVAAAIAGVPAGSVNIHTVFAGGSFGRRATPNSDYIAEAVAIAKAADGAYPVKLHWTREDDFASGRYRPMGYHVARAAIDEGGQPVAWEHRIVISSFMQDTPFAGPELADGIDSSALEGSRNLPYAVANVKVDLHLARVGVPTLWWRSVGHTQNGWISEVMIDQLARAAGADPVAYRMELLADHPRHRGVLALAAERAGWSQPAPEGVHRGVAVHEAFSSFVAQVAEIRISDTGDLTVERVVCAVDCG
ncbi:MAG: molybdopterin cofactor-binding domain-containing protein, partial [Pseudomonadota bacterium]